MRGLDEMETLLKYCRLYGIEPRVAFDPSLARGLDYYTGAIFETVVKGEWLSADELGARDEGRAGN